MYVHRHASQIWLLIVVALLTVGTAHAQTTLVSTGSTWRYLDNGTDQGTAWVDSAFVDTAWAEGPAQLGYGDGDEATIVSYGPGSSNKYVTTYFRHSFDVVDPGLFPYLHLKLLRDDGAVVYLNGAEIHRSNMPPGSIDYTTFALSTIGGADEDAFEETFIYPNNLVSGTNLIAVEIHQVSATSSDISFDLELLGLTELPTLMRKAPYLIYPGVNTQMQILWQLVLTDTCTLEWGLDTLYSMGSQQMVEYGTDHQFRKTVIGLTPAALYCYRVIVQGEEYRGTFRAAPETNATSVKFIAYGDTRTYPADHDGVAAKIVAEYVADPEFQTMLIPVGDLVSDGDLESDWDTEFFDPAYANIQAMLATLPYQSCIGNHEGAGVLFTKYFPYPFVGGRYWSFDYGPAHFAVVDQYTSYVPGSAQYIWLESDLASTTRPWKFIYLHEPGWSAGGHSNNTVVQDYIQPLCETYGVQIVFAGHNHYYARGVVNGVHHITTGGGGAPPYNPTAGWPNIVTQISAYHYCKVEINAGFLDYTAITRSGTVIDTFSVWLPGAAVTPGGMQAPSAISVTAAGPNPFGSGTLISCGIPEDVQAELAIYTVDGRRIRTLAGGLWQAGHHSVEWDGCDDSGEPVSSGIYFCRLQAGSHRASAKLILSR
jgi:hypothetical protein